MRAFISASSLMTSSLFAVVVTAVAGFGVLADWVLVVASAAVLGSAGCSALADASNSLAALSSEEAPVREKKLLLLESEVMLCA
jgi:hypothetical protein